MTPYSKACLECRALFTADDLKRPESFKRTKYCSRPCYDKARTFDPTSPAKCDLFFWPKVDRSGGPAACWPWLASKFKVQKKQMGYGRFAGSGPYTYSHRVAWIIVNGPIPADRLVMHSCDNPVCCNPAHMRLGTDAENLADARSKGRHSHGERARSKLTEEQAKAILREYRKDGPHKRAPSNTAELAERYGVSRGTITQLIRGVTWSHLHASRDIHDLR